MTDTPEKIGLITVAFGRYRLFDRLKDKTADATAYIRADIHEAAVAAAYEAAAHAVENGLDAVIAESGERSSEVWGIKEDAKLIRALTPDDAKAALEAVKRAEYERGIRSAARDRH